jgi:hypothetical protein
MYASSCHPGQITYPHIGKKFEGLDRQYRSDLIFSSLPRTFSHEIDASVVGSRSSVVGRRSSNNGTDTQSGQERPEHWTADQHLVRRPKM